MAVSTKFIASVSTQLMLSPGTKIFAGHKFPRVLMNEVKSRPDVVAKIARLAYSLKSAKLGANGLKRQKNFWIRGYKNFVELQNKSAADIAAFTAGLSEADAAVFNNNDIYCIALVPEHKGKETYDADLDAYVVKNIKGKSVGMTFDKAISKEYKVPGCAYIVFLVGDSAIRRQETVVATRTNKRNGLIVMREVKPAKVKKKLRFVAERKEIAAARQQLTSARQQLGLTRQLAKQQAFMTSKFGANPGQAYTQRLREYGFDRSSKYSNVVANAVATANAAGYTGLDSFITEAIMNVISGDSANARAVLSSVISDRSVVTEILSAARKGSRASVSNPAAIVNKRIGALNSRIRSARSANAQHDARIAQLIANGGQEANAQELRKLRSKVSANTRRIGALNARKGYYKPGRFGSTNYTQQLARVNAAVESAKLRGANARQALNAAMAQVSAPQQVKQQIAAQAQQAIVNQQVPVQLAVQQAIQAVQNQVAAMPVQVAQQVPLKPRRGRSKKVVGAQQLSGDFTAQQLLGLVK